MSPTRRITTAMVWAVVWVGGVVGAGCDAVSATSRVGPAEADSPVVWFPLSDRTSIGHDRSGNGAHASATGLVIVADDIRGNVAFCDGGALVFVPPVRSDFTIAFWIKTQQAGPDQRGWIQGPHIIDADLPSFHLDFGVGLSLDKLVFGVGTPDDGPMDMIALKSMRSVVDGTWHHVALTRDGQTGMRQIFIDGVFDVGEPALPGELTLPTSMMFGGTGVTSLSTPSPPLRAHLSDARFYDRVLSDAAIAFLATL